MDINIIKYIFLFYVFISGLLILPFHCMEIYFAVIAKRNYNNRRFSIIIPQPMIKKSETPKKWYDFHVFIGPVLTITLCLILYKYLHNGNVPEIIFTLLDTLLGVPRKPLVPTENVILAITLLNIHVWKKYAMYDALNDEKISMFLHVLKFVHWIGLIASMIGESEGFIKGYGTTSLSWHILTNTDLICAFICLCSSYMQRNITCTPRRPRKNRRGVIISHIYILPVGGLFKYISNPLEFTEILVHLMLSVILWQASTFHYVMIWIVISQVEFAILSHQWYLATFRDYPKERKVLIPYIW